MTRLKCVATTAVRCYLLSPYSLPRNALRKDKREIDGLPPALVEKRKMRVTGVRACVRARIVTSKNQKHQWPSSGRWPACCSILSQKADTILQPHSNRTDWMWITLPQPAQNNEETIALGNSREAYGSTTTTTTSYPAVQSSSPQPVVGDVEKSCHSVRFQVVVWYVGPVGTYYCLSLNFQSAASQC